MSASSSRASQRVPLKLEELRDSFDSSFARPPPVQHEPGEALLRLRVGTTSLAVRLSELAGLHLMPRLVRLPGAPATLLGLAGLRGQLFAVHDLAPRLGLTSAEPPGWLLLTAGARRVGLAATGFEGQLRALAEQQHDDAVSASHPLLARRVRLPGGGLLPVLDVEALMRQLWEEGSRSP